MKEELKREFEARIKAKKGELASPLTLDQILQLKLSELSRRNIALKIYSEVLGCEIWLCGNEQMAKQLKEDDPGAVIYTANEMKRLLSLNPDPKGLMNIHTAKTIFPGSKIVDSRLKQTSDES